MLKHGVDKHSKKILVRIIIINEIMLKINFIKLLIIFMLLWSSCSSKSNDTVKNKPQDLLIPKADNEQTIIKYNIEIIKALPHDTTYYTQGLAIHKNKLYEGTGLEGNSKLVKFDLKKWTIEKDISLKTHYFGEGITILDDKIYQITWLNQTCLVYDLKTMKQINEFTYAGEGWGLTSNDSILFMSDGSSTIRLINPKNFTVTSNINIMKNNSPMRFINELELVDSLLFANIYGMDLIIIANINTGKVVGEIDISVLRPLVSDYKYSEVSNGIAYDKENELFYLTGKYWNKIFVVKIVEEF
jgi:glutamine cyclotransferase